MKKENYIKIMSKLQPDYLMGTRIKERISTKNSKEKSYRNTYIMRVIAIAVVFIVVFVGVRFTNLYNGINNYKDNVNKDTESKKFESFKVIAYASDGRDRELGQGVEVLMEQYSPLISSAPGIPFSIQYKESIDEMKIEVNKGNIILWHKDDGVVENKGKIYEGKKEDIIYWSPLENQKLVDENTEISIKVIKDKNIVEEKQVSIKLIDEKKGIYSAKVR